MILASRNPTMQAHIDNALNTHAELHPLVKPAVVTNHSSLGAFSTAQPTKGAVPTCPDKPTPA